MYCRQNQGEDMAEELLLTPNEAFARIRVKRAKGFQMLASGELPSIKVGRLRRIPVEALRRWVEERMKEAEVVED
jgi:excisionase family DNA binding protein